VACGRTEEAEGTPTPPAFGEPAQPAPEPTPPPPVHALSDGTTGYDYTPQIAYVDREGVAWLVTPGAEEGIELFASCGVLDAGAQQRAITPWLAWSPDGGSVACYGLDGAVSRATASGRGETTVFGPGDCANPPPLPVLSPGGRFVACHGSDLLIAAHDGARQGGIGRATLGAPVSWSPAGQYLVYHRGVGYGVVDAFGRVVAELDDATAKSALLFAWSADGQRLAYPSTRGLAVLEVSSGTSRVVPTGWLGSEVRWEAGPRVAWALGGEVLLVWGLDADAGGEGLAVHAVRAADGARGADSVRSLMAAQLAPDGRQLAVLRRTEGGPAIEVVDLETGEAARVQGATLQRPSAAQPPGLVFAGDSSRLCWVEAGARPADAPAAACARSDGGGVVRVQPPVRLAPWLDAASGAGLWTAFSPDLTRVAWVTRSSAGAPYVLRVAALDGSGAVEVGPVAGPHAFAWRPDGVWQPAVTP
jgi:hypothetical protein